MTQQQDDHESALVSKWHHAERRAKVGDHVALIDLLRSLSPLPSASRGVPDLRFIADLIEGRFRKRRGRPRSDKSVLEDGRETTLEGKWNRAERTAVGGDNGELIDLLRSISLSLPSPDRTHEVPNFWFVADLLEGRFKKHRGRPRSNKISSGLKELLIANTVESVRLSTSVSIEEAVAKVTENQPRLESKTQKSYFRAKKANLIQRRRKAKSP